MRITEDWCSALDENKYVAAILMDLSKAFDCLPHDLLLGKLKYYGLSDSALSLIGSYLSDRKQCVQLGTSSSSWVTVQKGVPQGSILGPLLFNVFINDIFHFVHKSSLYNYADDNTLSAMNHDFIKVKHTIEQDGACLITFSKNNNMKANPVKFWHESYYKCTSFNINGTNIDCEIEGKLYVSQ